MVREKGPEQRSPIPGLIYMKLMDVEIMLIAIIVVVSYFLPFLLWLFHLHDKSKLSKMGSEKEYKDIIWFNRQKLLSLNEIRDELHKKEMKANKLLRLLFTIVLPVICFLVNIILIKHIGSYYVKKKFDFDLPATSIINYVMTLVLLCIWTTGVLMNKLLIQRINDLLKKADELEGKQVQSGN